MRKCRCKSKFKICKKCFYEIPLVDRCLTIFMLILLIQLAYGLFVQGQSSPLVNTIDVIVRTSTASIFGYFLSANFIRHKSTDHMQHMDIGKGTRKEKSESSEDQIQNRIGFITSDSKSEVTDEESEGSTTEYEEQETIVENRMQILIATFIGLFCLVSLLLLRNVSEWHPALTNSESVTSTIAQFRDFISGCVGFLVGSPSYRSK